MSSGAGDYERWGALRLELEDKELVALLVWWNSNMEANRQDKTAMARSAARSQRRLEADRAVREWVLGDDDDDGVGEMVGI